MYAGISNMQKENKIFDLLIIGGGPAGLSAAIYAARYKLDTVVLALDFGQIAKAPCVENYPGAEGITGLELAKRFREQAKNQGAPIKNEEAVSIKKLKKGFEVVTREGTRYETRIVLIGTGASHRKLNIENEDKYIGKGVSYCSTCDAPMFKGKIAVVAGGSDAAAVSALHIANYAKSVTIIYRGDELRAEPTLVQKIKSKPSMSIITKANIVKLNGDKRLTSIKLDNGEELKLDGLFIEIGQVPSTGLAKQIGIKLTEKDYIKVDSTQMTNVPGIFAAGDITDSCNHLKQILTSASQGAVAANAIFKFLNL